MSAGWVAKTSHFALYQWQRSKNTALNTKTLINPSRFDGGKLVFGAITPKKCAKSAVTRNLIRRQVQAVIKERSPKLVSTIYVIRLRDSFKEKSFMSASSVALKKVVRQELIQLFEKIETK